MSPETPNANSFRVDAFYIQLGFPEASLLDRRIFKRMVRDHGELTVSDKRILSEDVSKLTWKFTLKPSTVQVHAYEDADREYLEVALVEVELNGRRHAARITEMIQRAIPYPVLLILVESHGIAISVAHKRFSQASKGSIVAEHFLRSPWIEDPLSDLDNAFLDALAMNRLSKLNFYALYRDLCCAVLARICAELTGTFELDGVQFEEERRQGLEQSHQIDRELSNLRAAIAKEERFAEKVELNTQIKALEAWLATTIAKL